MRTRIDIDEERHLYKLYKQRLWKICRHVGIQQIPRGPALSWSEESELEAIEKFTLGLSAGCPFIRIGHSCKDYVSDFK